MHTVAQTYAFLKAAKASSMTDDEISDLVTFIAENPTAGEVIRGTGGCRKVRVKAKGKGKRGGFRTITFFSGDNMPVFLITVFSKGERIDLSKSEQNALKEITEAIVAEYETRVTSVARKGA